MKKKIKENENFDIDKYVGKWYEIATIPARFQRNCEKTQAIYTKKDDYIEVHNSCYNTKKNKTTDIKGKAFTTDEDRLLKVQFFWPFRANYKIEFIDNNYEYAIVGSKSDKYGWILSRNNEISDEKYDHLMHLANEKGLNVEKMKKTKH